jgi:PAS domain-containing protein
MHRSVAAIATPPSRLGAAAQAVLTTLVHRSLAQTVQLFDREQNARAAAEEAVGRVRRPQSAVEKERGTLAAVMGSMSDGLLVLAPAGQVRYGNARAGELLGLEPSQLIGQPFDRAIGAIAPFLVQPNVVRETLSLLVRNPDGRPTAEFVVADPERRHILASAFPVAGAGETGVGLLLRDVTSAKRLAVLEERQRIAMDLHDGVIQSLYGVTLGLGARLRSLGAIPTRRDIS